MQVLPISTMNYNLKCCGSKRNNTDDEVIKESQPNFRGLREDSVQDESSEKALGCKSTLHYYYPFMKEVAEEEVNKEVSEVVE